MTGVSIIIPVYNAFDELKSCIASIYADPPTLAFEAIVVDNGSRPEVGDWLAAQQQQRRNFRFLRFDQPLGFARAVNQGARHARFDSLALLNSDTIPGPGWLDLLAAALAADPSLGIVSPVTNRCGHELQRDPQARSLTPEDTSSYARSIRNRPGIRFEPQRLVFFCVLIRRLLWEQLAGLDETFATGNFEDDDFCLRARLSGYRMAVVLNAFVFHHERATFQANALNHSESMARNQTVFAERARRWSTSLRPVFPAYSRAQSLSVIVPVAPERAAALEESLASLANQTVQGFETVVVHPPDLDLATALEPFAARLRLRIVAKDGDAASLLNAGLASAQGSEIAYLPASDIFHPVHLELLWNALTTENAGAVYSAWNVAAGGRRGTVAFPEAEPDIELGDWAPVLCWMHQARLLEGLSFDPSFGAFAPWHFLLNLRRRGSARYLCRVTCERRPDPPHASDAAAVERLFHAFPVDHPWKETQRQPFLDAVRAGNWEDRLIISHNDRVRRARQLLGEKAPALLRKRFEDAASSITLVPTARDRTDVVLFSSVEWSALTQRPHHFATGLAARGHRVFWIDVQFRPPEFTATANLMRNSEAGVHRVELPATARNLYRIEWRPDALETAFAAFSYLRAAHGISAAVQLVHFPLWEPLCDLLRSRFAWPVFYDCLDDQQAFSNLFGHELKGSESRLLETSSGVTVSGHTLLETVRGRRPDAVLIPNAADFELFHHAPPAGLLAHLARPIAGFFGAFADWLDFDWIEAAARRFPAWSFVYVGREGFAGHSAKARWRQLQTLPNLHVFPQAPLPQLARYLAEFDVCTMPFADLPATRGMNAVKLYEYLAAGKPVVAPDLPEPRRMREAGLIETYRTTEESFPLLEQAVHQGSSKEAINFRVTFARNNTWNHRVEALSRLLFPAVSSSSCGAPPIS